MCCGCTGGISYGNSIGLCQALSGTQIVNGAVGNSEGPANRTCTIGRSLIGNSRGEGPYVAASDSHRSHQLRVGQVNICYGKAVRYCQDSSVFSSCQVGDFCDAACEYSCADHRHIVGTGHDDGYQLVNHAAMPVTDRNGECFSGGLIQCQILRGAVGYRVGPDNRARLGCS